MADQMLEGSQPVDLSKHPSGIVPTLQFSKKYGDLGFLYYLIWREPLRTNRSHLLQVMDNNISFPNLPELSGRNISSFHFGNVRATMSNKHPNGTTSQPGYLNGYDMPIQTAFSSQPYMFNAAPTPRYSASSRQSSPGDYLAQTPKKRKGDNNDVEVDSPKKGPSNKRWSPECSKFLIGFLVSETKNGKKIDKGFKKPTYTEAAHAVNKRFKMNFTSENVNNHYRSLRKRWSDICICRNLSGAGWDEELKMITLEEPTASDYIKCHPHHGQFINTPIKNYDNLELIVGNDLVTGSFRKHMYEKWSLPNNDELIDVDDDSNQPTEAENSIPTNEIDILAPQEERKRAKGTNKDDSSVKTSTSKKPIPPKRRKVKNEEGSYNVLLNEVKVMATALSATASLQIKEKLSKAVYDLEGYNFTHLDAAFSMLQRDNEESTSFIAKPLIARRSWMDRFVSGDV